MRGLSPIALGPASQNHALDSRRFAVGVRRRRIAVSRAFTIGGKALDGQLNDGEAKASRCAATRAGGKAERGRNDRAGARRDRPRNP
jgi:hypothetical protein